MKTYKATVKLTTDYLQAKFSEDAKKELEDYVSKGIIKNEEDSWKVLLYFDEKGIYIPNIHIRNSLVIAGRYLKLKKQRRSLEQRVISNILIKPDKIYLNKTEPDKIIISYPKRKDGNRIKIIHPAINSETAFDFELEILDEMELKTIKQLIEIAGKNTGIGARRRDMFGRFKLINLI